MWNKRKSKLMKLFLKLIIVFILFLFPFLIQAQTPIANRVKAMAKHLPEGANVIAKYTDNKRHCLYYGLHNRLFRYDVIKNKSENVEFSSSGYARMLNTFVSPKGDFIFVVVAKIQDETTKPYDNEELWRYDSHSKKSSKIGSGFKVEKRKDYFVIKKVSKKKDSIHLMTRQRWTAKDYYFDLDGHIIWGKDEYQIDLRKLR